jgi:hypothetical protein
VNFGHALDVNIGTGGQAPLLRTLKQMGDTIRQGGFCTAKKEENIVKSETEKAVDTTTGTNSLSDNSHEELLENVKSVSFSKLCNSSLPLDLWWINDQIVI